MSSSALYCLDLANVFFLAGIQTVNAYSKDEIDITNVEWYWALMFVGQRLKFLLEKEKVLCAFCVS
jgi:hypothetical protein